MYIYAFSCRHPMTIENNFQVWKEGLAWKLQCLPWGKGQWSTLRPVFLWLRRVVAAWAIVIVGTFVLPKRKGTRGFRTGVESTNSDCCHYRESVLPLGIVSDALCIPLLNLPAALQGRMSNTHYIGEEIEPQTSLLLSAHS